MKNKFLIFIVAMIMTVVALASCKIGGGEGNKGNGGGNNECVIYSPTTMVAIVRGSDFDNETYGITLSSLSRTIYEKTTKLTVIVDTGMALNEHEIVFGNAADRTVSVQAQAALDKAMRRLMIDYEDRGESTKHLVGYGVYASGGSVAIVWNNDNAMSFAIDHFMNTYTANDTLSLEDGFFELKTFSMIDYYKELDAEKKANEYAAVELEYGSEVVEAIKQYRSMIDENYYMWLADLYDPGLYDEDGNPLGGGFYFSNSGRDNDGYGVDLETTMQVMSYLVNSGMFNSEEHRNSSLPDKMKAEMLAFALKCQSPVDGYFYHPQWGTNVTTSRIGRDAGWATQIISMCGGKPYWNTNNGVKGIYGKVPGYEIEDMKEYLANAVPVAAYDVADTLPGKSTVSAVSKVIATAQIQAPGKWTGSEWFATLDAYNEYLQSYAEKLDTSSYSIGNNFAAQSGQITGRDKLIYDQIIYVRSCIANNQSYNIGSYTPVYRNNVVVGIENKATEEHYELIISYKDNGEEVVTKDRVTGGYCDATIAFFNYHQKDNGLWEDCSIADGTVYYNAINGLMKISSVYNSCKAPFPRIEEAFDAAIFMVTYLEREGGFADDRETWTDSKGKKPNGSVDVYNPWVASSALLSNAANYHGDQQLRANLRATLKANAAEMIRISTIKAAQFDKGNGQWGYNWGGSGGKSQGAPVAISGTWEGDVNGGNIATNGVYRNMLSTLGISGLKFFGVADGILFLDRIAELEPVIKEELDSSVAMVVTEPLTFDDEVEGTTEPADLGLTLNTGSIEVISDERGDGNVLKFVSVGGDNQGTTVSVAASTAKSPNCLVLEWDMRYEKISSNSSFQIKMGSGDSASYMITLTPNKTTGVLTVGDSSSTGPGISTSIAEVDAYEWHTFRVEYYLIDSTEKQTITKIYIDNVLRGLSNNYYGKQKETVTPGTYYDKAAFYATYDADCTVYFDNMYAYQTQKEYKEEPIVNPDRIKDFENAFVGTTMPKGVTSDGAVVVETYGENSGNKALLLSGNSKIATVSSVVSGAGANAYTVTTLMKIGAGADGDISKLYLTGGKVDTAMIAYKLARYTEGGVQYASLTEFNKEGATGATFKGLPVGEWFTLTLEFYPYQYKGECSSVYLGDIKLGNGSLYYTINNIAKTYSAFVIQNSADADIYLDDIIAESIPKTFVNSAGASGEDPKIELPSGGKGGSVAATDDHNGKFDFEGAPTGVVSIPGVTTAPNSKEYGNNLEIVVSPDDAANQVLMHKAAPSTSAGNTTTFTASKVSLATANCYVYEFSLMTEKFTKGGIQISMKGLKPGNNTDLYNIFQSDITVSGNWKDSEGTILFKAKTDSAGYKDKDGKTQYTIDGVYDSEGALKKFKYDTDVNYNPDYAMHQQQVLASVPVSGWLKVRIEVYPEKNIAQIYLDDEFRAETSGVYSLNSDAVLSTANLYTTYGTDCLMYIDDVTVEAIEKKYSSKIPVGEGTPAGDGWGDSGDDDSSDDNTSSGGGEITDDYNGRFDFEGYQLGSFDIPGMSANIVSAGSIGIMYDPRDPAKNVLQFDSAKNSENPDRIEILNAKVKSGKATTYVLEFESLFESVPKNTTVALQIKLGESYMLVLGFDENGMMQISDASQTTWSAAKKSTFTTVNPMEWNKIRVEYSVVSGDAIAKVYVNDNEAFVSDNYFDASAKNAPSFSCTTATICALSSTVCTMYLDNVALYETSDTVVVEDYTHIVHRAGKTFYYTPESTVYTFEDGVLKPSGMSNSYSSPTTVAVINNPFTADVESAVGKVLNFTVDKTQAKESVLSISGPTNLDKTIDSETGDYVQRYGEVVFSYDVRYDGLVTPNSQVNLHDIIFNYAIEPNRYENEVKPGVYLSSSYYNFIRIYIDADGKFTFGHCNDGWEEAFVGDTAKGATYATDIVINDGKWHNIRFVLNKQDLNSTLSIFVDNICVADSFVSYYSSKGCVLNSYISSVTFRQKTKSAYLESYDVYYDNIVYEYVNADTAWQTTK